MMRQSRASRAAGAFLCVSVVLGCASAPRAAPDRSAGDSPEPVVIAPRTDELLSLLLLIEDRRLFEPTVVARALAGTEPERAALADALGRLADPRGEQSLLLLLRDESVAVRRAAAHALRSAHVSSTVAVDALLLAAADPDRETAVRALRALAQTGVPLERIAQALASLSEDEIWRRLAPVLPLLPEPARRELVASGLEEAPADLRPLVALAGTFEPSTEALPQVRTLLEHGDVWVRGLAAREVGRLGTGGGDLALLEERFDDEPFVASQALLAAESILRDGRAAPPAAWAERLLARLPSAVAHADLGLAIASLLRHYVFTPGVAGALVALGGEPGPPALRGAAVESLLWAGEARGVDLLGELAASQDARDRSEAARVAARSPWPLGTVAPLERLLVERLLVDPEPEVRAMAIRAIFAQAELLGRDRLRAAALAIRSDPNAAVRAELFVQLQQRPALGMEELLARAGSRLESEPDDIARRELVGALSARGASERLDRGAIVALLEHLADDDPSHLVRAVASDALERFGRPVPAVRPVHAVDQVGAYRELVLRTREPRIVVIETSRGELRLRLDCPLAPKSCLSFLQLADQGFFRGQLVEERRPGIAILAGDPSGTGHGGPGYRLRDELTPVELDAPGVFLLERPFRDGAGSRFAITLSPQPWRSGREVAFGRVVGGLDVLFSLRPGDRIVDIRIAGAASLEPTRAGRR